MLILFFAFLDYRILICLNIFIKVCLNPACSYSYFHPHILLPLFAKKKNATLHYSAHHKHKPSFLTLTQQTTIYLLLHHHVKQHTKQLHIIVRLVRLMHVYSKYSYAKYETTQLLLVG